MTGWPCRGSRCGPSRGGPAQRGMEEPSHAAGLARDGTGSHPDAQPGRLSVPTAVPRAPSAAPGGVSAPAPALLGAALGTGQRAACPPPPCPAGPGRTGRGPSGTRSSPRWGEDAFPCGNLPKRLGYGGRVLKNGAGFLFKGRKK